MIHAENRLAPRMVLIITNHEYRRKLEQTFQNFRIPIYYQCQGHGTAPSLSGKADGGVRRDD